ncbi:MAG: T9SS type A sorting domain-containing protein, partial [Bacteroidota bacterium]|nr:T9SS type A sorting domain-containing protein [Bacteroidota bacterium]
ITLKIYDVLGREVKTLINNQVMKAGTYTYNFDGKNLSSGTYLYRITAGDFVSTKKMILMK